MVELSIRMEVPNAATAKVFENTFRNVSELHNAISSHVLGHDVEDPSWEIFMDMMGSEQRRLKDLAIVLQVKAG